MACALTSSFPLDCLDGVGGIREIKVKTLPSTLTGYTLTSGVISTSAGDARNGWYTYVLPQGTAMLTETTTVNRSNGTNFSAVELKVIINKLRANVRNELKLLSQARLQVAIKTYDASYWIVGYENGLVLESSANSTGTAKGDRTGYEMTFKGEEVEPMGSISSTTYDLLVTA